MVVARLTFLDLTFSHSQGADELAALKAAEEEGGRDMYDDESVEQRMGDDDETLDELVAEQQREIDQSPSAAPQSRMESRMMRNPSPAPQRNPSPVPLSPGNSEDYDMENEMFGDAMQVEAQAAPPNLSPEDDRIDPLDLANYFDNLLDDDEIKQFVDDPALQAATRKGVPHTGLPPDWRDA